MSEGNQNPGINGEWLILVEGKTDGTVIGNIWTKKGIAATMPRIVCCGGIEKIKADLYAALQSGEISRIGVILDADKDAKSRFDKWKGMLRSTKDTTKLEIEHPEILKQGLTDQGLIVDCSAIAGDKRLGLWVMPNNKNGGMLEDFLRMTIRPGDKLPPLIDASLEKLKEEKAQLFKDTHRAKAYMATWAAWQEEPGLSLTVAVMKGLLATDVELSNNFASWLKGVFPDE